MLHNNMIRDFDYIDFEKVVRNVEVLCETVQGIHA